MVTGDEAPTAIIAGAGVGGLTAAVALHRIGWSVTVLERAPIIAEVGAGLSLWPNAIRALTTLDLAKAVEARAVPTISRGNLRTPAGRWLRHTHRRTWACSPSIEPTCTRYSGRRCRRPSCTPMPR